MTSTEVVTCRYCGCRFAGERRASLLTEHEPECIPPLMLSRAYDGEPAGGEATPHFLYLHPFPSDWPYASKGHVSAKMSHIAALIAAMTPEQRARLYELASDGVLMTVGSKIEAGDGDG